MGAGKRHALGRDLGPLIVDASLASTMSGRGAVPGCHWARSATQARPGLASRAERAPDDRAVSRTWLETITPTVRSRTWTRHAGKQRFHAEAMSTCDMWARRALRTPALAWHHVTPRGDWGKRAAERKGPICQLHELASYARHTKKRLRAYSLKAASFQGL